MSNKNDIKKIVTNHSRRLQKLKEQKALGGLSVDPKVLIEIDDIETQIQKLQTKLKKLEGLAVENNIQTSCVQVILEGSIVSFDDSKRKTLVRVLAAILDIEEGTVRVLKVEEGSTKVTIGIPTESAEKLRLLQGLEPTNFELFRQTIEEGKTEYWEVIYSQYAGLVRHWVISSGISEDKIEDYVQDTFARFWQFTSSSKFSEKFETIDQVLRYLKVITKTTVFDKKRKEQRQSSLLETLTEAQVSSKHKDVENKIAMSDLLDRIDQLLENDIERIVFKLSFIEGLPPRQIYGEYPGLFTDLATIYRIKRSIIDRIRKEIGEYFSSLRLD